MHIPHPRETPGTGPNPSLLSATPPSPSSLTDELSRRLSLMNQVRHARQGCRTLPAAGLEAAAPTLTLTHIPTLGPQAELHDDGGGPDGTELYLCEARHDESGAEASDQADADWAPAAADGCGAGLVSKWRQKERLKTTAVALVVCLNIGVDPPDVIKISPCARLECWVDPLSMQAPKALDTIGAGVVTGVSGHGGVSERGLCGCRRAGAPTLGLAGWEGALRDAEHVADVPPPSRPPAPQPPTHPTPSHPRAARAQARTCRRSTSGGSRGPSTRCTWTPRPRT